MNPKNTLLFMGRTICIALLSMTLWSCKDSDGLAREYMPDMYRSPAVETYVDYADYGHPDSLMARLAVKGTVSRGHKPYPYSNTAEGYELAGEHLSYGIPNTEKNVSEGKVLFGMFCVHCHGKKGDGNGILAERDKFPPVPTKFNEDLILPVGKMFHTITYGKGIMGSHASQLSKKERWQLIHYIESKFKVNSKAEK